MKMETDWLGKLLDMDSSQVSRLPGASLDTRDVVSFPYTSWDAQAREHHFNERRLIHIAQPIHSVLAGGPFRG